MEEDRVGFIDEKTRAIFGRGYAAGPDSLIEPLKQDDAIAEADTLLIAVRNQLGVACNAHVIEALLTRVAPALGRRRRNSELRHRNARCQVMAPGMKHRISTRSRESKFQ